MKLNGNELRCILAIGGVAGLTTFAIGLIIPIFSVYAISYEGASFQSVGIAFGIYALARGLTEIPFGMASDRLGRKPVVMLGLAIFCAGSVLCAFADSIGELIAARTLQGSGAIGAVLTASLGDATRSGVRAQSFVIVGIIVAVAFLFSTVAGPLLAARLGFGNLFFLLAAAGFAALCLAFFLFPKLPERKPGDRKEISLKLRDPEVRRVLFSAFTVSFAVHLFFFVYPLSWNGLGFDPSRMWFVYLVILAPAMLVNPVYIRISERRKELGRAINVGLLLLAVSFSVYLLGEPGVFTLYVAGGAFFLGFGVFQSTLPAFFTQRVSPENRGFLTGFFNVCNLLGACAGAMSCGALYGTHESLPLAAALFLLVVWRLAGFPSPPLGKAGKSGE